MNELLPYLAKSTLSLSLLYLAFRAMMHKEAFFTLTRMVLLSIVICSCLIPFAILPKIIHPEMQQKLMPVFPVIENQLPAFPEVADPPQISEMVTLPAQKPERAFPVVQIIGYVYLAGVLISLLFLIHGLVTLLLLFRKAEIQKKGGYKLLILEKDIPAFSFWKMVIISRTDFDEHGPTILAHEQQHIRLGHFYDLMLMEMVKMVHWFNPIIYWLIQDVKAIHEFQADQSTLTQGIDVNKYQLLIIEKGVGSQRFALANSFNHCQIKKRITMMNKSKTSKAGIWKVATFLPLLALLLIFCSRIGGNEPPENSFHYNEQSGKLDQCFLLSESSSQPFKPIKFEIDLVGGNVDETYPFEDSTKVKQLIRLSLSPKEKCWLTDGEYKFSSLNTDLRPWMSFLGNVRIGNKQMEITGGELLCKKDSNKINLSFNLKVDKDQEIKGSYTGDYSNITRIPKAFGQSTQIMPKETRDEFPMVLIEMRQDGIYFNNQLNTLEEILEKVQTLGRTDKGRISFQMKMEEGVIFSEKQMNEWQKISETRGMPRFMNYQADQRAEFPGGSTAMHQWITDHLQYPKEVIGKHIEGIASVDFLVKSDGKLVDPKITMGIDPALNAEVIRLIALMPSWKPALKKGTPVDIYQGIQIHFDPK